MILGVFCLQHQQLFWIQTQPTVTLSCLMMAKVWNKVTHNRISLTSLKDLTHAAACRAMMASPSGRHYWEVKVMDAGGWVMGVSLQKMWKRRMILNLSQSKAAEQSVVLLAKYFLALTSSHCILLPEISTPKWIWIYLDYEEGWVVLFSVDEDSSIFTFPLVLSEGKKIHFWFCLGPGMTQNITVMNGRE